MKRHPDGFQLTQKKSKKESSLLGLGLEEKPKTNTTSSGTSASIELAIKKQLKQAPRWETFTYFM